MRALNRIREHVSKLVEGEVFTTREILKLGKRSNIDTTLHRLVKRKTLIRLAAGVFMKYGEAAEIPSVDEIVRIKAAAFGRSVVAHAQRHANRMVLTEDCRQDLYSTDGASTSFMANNTRVLLKKGSIRQLQLGDTNTGMVLRALWYLGRHEVTAETISNALKLQPVDLAAAITRLLRLLPQWLVARISMFLSADGTNTPAPD